MEIFKKKSLFVFAVVFCISGSSCYGMIKRPRLPMPSQLQPSQALLGQLNAIKVIVEMIETKHENRDAETLREALALIATVKESYTIYPKERAKLDHYESKISSLLKPCKKTRSESFLCME